jgi:hypothetical protein
LNTQARQAHGDVLMRETTAPARLIVPAAHSPFTLEAEMKKTPTLDHIALTAPNLDELVERLTSAFGMVRAKSCGG